MEAGIEYNELNKNLENILDVTNTVNLMRNLRDDNLFRGYKGINPPLLILVSGVSLSGKRSLSTFLDRHIKADYTNKIKLLNTDSILKLIGNHISAEENPILH